MGQHFILNSIANAASAIMQMNGKSFFLHKALQLALFAQSLLEVWLTAQILHSNGTCNSASQLHIDELMGVQPCTCAIFGLVLGQED